MPVSNYVLLIRHVRYVRFLVGPPVVSVIPFVRYLSRLVNSSFTYFGTLLLYCYWHSWSVARFGLPLWYALRSLPSLRIDAEFTYACGAVLSENPPCRCSDSIPTCCRDTTLLLVVFLQHPLVHQRIYEGDSRRPPALARRFRVDRPLRHAMFGGRIPLAPPHGGHCGLAHVISSSVRD